MHHQDTIKIFNNIKNGIVCTKYSIFTYYKKIHTVHYFYILILFLSFLERYVSET